MCVRVFFIEKEVTIIINGAGPVCFGVKFRMIIKLKKTVEPATINRKWKWYNFQWMSVSVYDVCVRDVRIYVRVDEYGILMRWEVMHLLIYEAITSFDNSRETQMDG